MTSFCCWINGSRWGSFRGQLPHDNSRLTGKPEVGTGRSPLATARRTY